MGCEDTLLKQGSSTNQSHSLSNQDPCSYWTESPLFSKEPYTSEVEELKLGSSSKIDIFSSFGTYKAMIKQDAYCSGGISRLTESIEASGLYSISLITYYITLTQDSLAST